MCRHRRSLQRHAVRQKVTLAFLLALKDQIFSPCSHTRKKNNTNVQHESYGVVIRQIKNETNPTVNNIESSPNMSTPRTVLLKIESGPTMLKNNNTKPNTLDFIHHPSLLFKYVNNGEVSPVK
jgi:hypothetical protein